MALKNHHQVSVLHISSLNMRLRSQDHLYTSQGLFWESLTFCQVTLCFIRSRCYIVCYISMRPNSLEWKIKRGRWFYVINLSHHNYHMYTVQLNLFQFFPTVIIQTCGFIFYRKLAHSLHYAALFSSTKTTHALASKFTSLLNLYLILTFKEKELTENGNNSSLESSTVASRSRCSR